MPSEAGIADCRVSKCDRKTVPRSGNRNRKCSTAVCGQSVTWDHKCVLLSRPEMLPWYDSAYWDDMVRQTTNSSVHSRSDTDGQWRSAWTRLGQERPASVTRHVVAARDRGQTFWYCWQPGQRHLTHVVVCRSSSLAQLQGLSCSNRHASRWAHAQVWSLTGCPVTSGFVASGEDDRSNWHWR